MAAAVDVLQVLAWQQAKKGTPRPKPIPRPGVKQDNSDVKKFGGTSLDVSDMRERLRIKNGR